MNNTPTPTPTPRTDNFKSQGREWLPLGIFEKVERELTAALEASTQWEAEAWRSDELLEQRDNELTAAREEIKELNDKLDDAVADATNAVNDIIRVRYERDEAREEIVRLTKGLADYFLKRNKAEEQRDRLAEALRKAISWGDSASHHILHRQNINWTYLNEAREALQSLNQNGKD